MCSERLQFISKEIQDITGVINSREIPAHKCPRRSLQCSSSPRQTTSVCGSGFCRSWGGESIWLGRYKANPVGCWQPQPSSTGNRCSSIVYATFWYICLGIFSQYKAQSEVRWPVKRPLPCQQQQQQTCDRLTAWAHTRWPSKAR